MATLVYSSKAIVKIKENKKSEAPSIEPTCLKLYQTLQMDGIETFKEIFRNNNKELIGKFFQHKFIKVIWPIIYKELKYEHCFKCFKGSQPN